MPTFLAFDIGNSGGRAMRADLRGDCIALETIHRFANQIVPVRGTLYWDVLYLWSGVLASLQQWKLRGGGRLDGIGLDTWSTDFALLDAHGRLLDNPVSNRDARTHGMMARVFERVPREELYARTGIQFMELNTLYQLYALVLAGSPALRHAATFLSVADLLNFWLTGRAAVEFTSATCTQFYDPNAGDWARDLLDRLDIPTAMLPEVVPAGTVLGETDAPGLDLRAPVVAVATHDTGSAVAGVPAEAGTRFGYVSSGTWSLIGTEVRRPVITPDSLKYDFTNEGGACGTFRLLKNALGMWLLQNCQETWAASGKVVSTEDAVQMAAAADPCGALIDPYPNSPDFRAPGDMPARIRAFAARTGQPVPQSDGAVLRCIFESLALKVRQVFEQLEIVQGHAVDVIHIVGGGSRNALLCRMTADATGRPVIAGPDEAAALGNAIVQAIATGHLASHAEGRALIRRSSALTTYEPRPSAAWDDAYARFLKIAGR